MQVFLHVNVLYLTDCSILQYNIQHAFFFALVFFFASLFYIFTHIFLYLYYLH